MSHKAGFFAAASQYARDFFPPEENSTNVTVALPENRSSSFDISIRRSIRIPTNPRITTRPAPFYYYLGDRERLSRRLLKRKINHDRVIKESTRAINAVPCNSAVVYDCADFGRLCLVHHDDIDSDHRYRSRVYRSVKDAADAGTMGLTYEHVRLDPSSPNVTVRTCDGEVWMPSDSNF